MKFSYCRVDKRMCWAAWARRWEFGRVVLNHVDLDSPVAQLKFLTTTFELPAFFRVLSAIRARRFGALNPVWIPGNGRRNRFAITFKNLFGIMPIEPIWDHAYQRGLLLNPSKSGARSRYPLHVTPSKSRGICSTRGALVVCVAWGATIAI